MYKKRIIYIDIAKGWAIIFIVIGHTLVHSEHCGLILKFLYSFHVMLFFMLSGFTYKIKENEKLIYFIKRKFIRILVPYFIWATLFLIPFLVFGSGVNENIGTTATFNIKECFFNIIYGNGAYGALRQNSSLWFLPALFTIEIGYYFIIKVIDSLIEKKKYIVVAGIVFLLILIGFITSEFLNIILPFGINTLLNIGYFFLLGYLLKKVINVSFFNNFIFNLIIFTIGLLCAVLNNTVMVIDYKYCNYFLMLVSALNLSLNVFYISRVIKNNKVLEYIGRNTMGILIFHKLIILVFQTKFGIISSLLLNSNIIIELLLTIFITIISVFTSLVISKVLKKIIPISIGEK